MVATISTAGHKHVTAIQVELTCVSHVRHTIHASEVSFSVDIGERTERRRPGLDVMPEWLMRWQAGSLGAALFLPISIQARIWQRPARC